MAISPLIDLPSDWLCKTTPHSKHLHFMGAVSFDIGRKNDLKADSLGAVIQRLAEFVAPVLGDGETGRQWIPSQKWHDRFNGLLIP